MIVVPLTLREANEFVLLHHRHNKPTRGCKFCIGAEEDGKLIGVSIVGRPLARPLDDGFTAEVLRLCTNPDSPKNTCSFLYGRSWRIWQQMGGTRMVTYTLQSESGSSLKGAGWKIVGNLKPRTGWSSSTRTREHQDVYQQAKFRWEAA
jgi:hypothetical protein